MMLNWQITVEILGYEFVKKNEREKNGIKYPEYKLVEIER